MKRFVRRHCWMSQRQLYDKMVEDLTNKTISDVVRNSESSLSLPQNELSGLQKGDTQRLAAYTYRKEEEHTFIQSETDNEDEDN